MYINLHYKCTRFHEMREMNISFLSLVGAFSIPTHRFLVWPIRSAIILLTMHIESPGLIGRGGCAVFYTISRFQNSVFKERNTSFKSGKQVSDTKFRLSNLHLKPVSLPCFDLSNRLRGPKHKI